MGDVRLPDKKNDGLTAMATSDLSDSSTKEERKFRKNTVEELRKKRVRRKKKKQELYKMSKRERVTFWTKKAVEPLQRKVEETEAKYTHERRISAFYWNKWKEDKEKYMKTITR